MDQLKIKNWEKWQSYRADRGQPPWIKVHRRLMRNVEWVSLSDSERGQLVAIWLLAGDHDGVIPASPIMIQKLCYMSSQPNIQRFVELGFIESNGVNLASSWRQDVTPDKNRIEENRVEEEYIVVKDDIEKIPFSEIIMYLNEKTGLNFRASTKQTKSLIRSRWNEGFRLNDFKVVIDKMFEAWGSDQKMMQYLRPQTLFSPKFEGYLNRKQQPKQRNVFLEALDGDKNDD